MVAMFPFYRSISREFLGFLLIKCYMFSVWSNVWSTYAQALQSDRHCEANHFEIIVRDYKHFESTAAQHTIAIFILWQKGTRQLVHLRKSFRTMRINHAPHQMRSHRVSIHQVWLCVAHEMKAIWPTKQSSKSAYLLQLISWFLVLVVNVSRLLNSVNNKMFFLHFLTQSLQIGEVKKRVLFDRLTFRCVVMAGWFLLWNGHSVNVVACRMLCAKTYFQVTSADLRKQLCYCD